MSRARIFVVEDDADHLESLSDLIEAAGFETAPFSDARDALAAIEAEPPDLVLTDLRMPGLDGIGLLEALAERGRDLPVVLLTGHGDVSHAVRAMRLGAEDFLEKPYDADHLLSVIERGLKTARLKAEVARLQDRLAAEEDLIGESRLIDAARRAIAEVAPLDIDVVLSGETGTGKELAARLLHRKSRRAGGPFVVVNCATLPEQGAEIELFGRSKRLHGAPEDVPGLVAAADGGTLFLDQADTLSTSLQPKLLRVLQTRRIESGGEPGRDVDFRVVASASRPLAEAIREGRFREDLYYRLAGFEIELPPLRAIPGDIPLLYDHFLAAAAARHGREKPEVTFQDRKTLQAHHWPGNAHELRIIAERRVLGLARPRAAAAVSGTSAGGTLRDLVAAYETSEIARVLDQCKGNTEAAARILGIPRRTLNDKIAKSDVLRKGRE